MKYRLLIIDLDGTLVPNLGMPPREFTASPYLIKAIQKAKKHLAVSLCTGRDKQTVIKVVNKLVLTTPQVISGGSKIIDAGGKDLWWRYISQDTAMKAMEILRKTKTSFSVVLESTEVLDEIPKDNFNKISGVLWYDLDRKQIRDLKKKLFGLQEIAITINQESTGSTVYITHREGTKDYAVKELMTMLGVKKKETIGIGDGNNDKPLLSVCGLKVAMGNAVQEVKDIADYIAPSVENDGVAEVIEKFVLV